MKPVNPCRFDYETLPEPTTLAERIKFVLGDRDVTPWCEQFGISRSRAHRIARKGQEPRMDELTAMSRVEGLRLEWLLSGQGRPFDVACFDADGPAAHYVEELLRDENWKPFVVTAPTGWIAVLLLGAEIMVNEVTLPYTEVEVVAGALGWQTLAALDTTGDLAEVEVSNKQLAALQAGWIGTYSLVGDARASGLLMDWHPPTDEILPLTKARAERQQPLTLREEGPDYEDSDELGRAFARAAQEDPQAARRRLLELLWTCLVDEDSPGRGNRQS